MAAPPPRPADRRKADTLAKLAAPAADVWIATAGEVPHLVPLSLCWVDERVILAVEATSRTARNIAASRVARLGLGPTRDVVLIDAVLEATYGVLDGPARLVDAYVAQSDWDPREAGDSYRWLVLRPVRIQAWREANEIGGRTLMRDGGWMV